MKKLIYSPLVLFIVLLAVSCQKDDSVAKPSDKVQLQDSLATVSLINNSNTAYEVAFEKTNYPLIFLKMAGKRLTLKPEPTI